MSESYHFLPSPQISQPLAKHNAALSLFYKWEKAILFSESSLKFEASLMSSWTTDEGYIV